MDHNYIDSTEEIDGLIVQVVDDPNPESPREGDMLATLFCWHPHYELGDEQFKNPDDVGGSRSMAEIAEWLKRERKAINLIPLFLYDHSGISMSCGATVPDDLPATDEQTTVERGSFGSRNQNGGYTWDTSMVGFAYTTLKQMELLGVEKKQVEVEAHETGFLRGTSKVMVDNVDHQIRMEVKEYDDFLTGNVWGYVITKPCPDPGHTELGDKPEQIASCPHSEVVESVWNFIGDTKYAHDEAVAAAKSLAQ
jgi:hypothetical protein